MIAVELGKILRDLALAERVVKRVVDKLRLDAVARCGIAVNLHQQRRSLGLLVGRDIAKYREPLHSGEDFGRPLVQFVEVGVLQRKFELRSRGAAAETHVLRRLHVEFRALDLLELRPQPGNDLLRVDVALLVWFQRDIHTPRIECSAAAADEHGDAVDGRIRLHDLIEFLLTPLHFGERDVLGHLRNAGYEAVVLLREKPLWNDQE